MIDSCHASRSSWSDSIRSTDAPPIEHHLLRGDRRHARGREPSVSLRAAGVVVAALAIPGFRLVHPPCPTWYVFRLLFPLAPLLPDAVCGGQSESRSARLPALPAYRH